MPLAFKVIEPAAAAPLVVPTKLTQPAVLIAALTLMLPVAVKLMLLAGVYEELKVIAFTTLISPLAII